MQNPKLTKTERALRMKIEDVVKGRYDCRSDIVEVTKVVPGKTARASRVRFVLRKKGRPTGALEVGDPGNWES